ncbi:MAG TPA: HEAT repeat domain-containing protein [Pyrinomonadaceae bacterium]|nr:HEAT repeat domain-containing protein [Pyrinomonadaceae bacterium]
MDEKVDQSQTTAEQASRRVRASGPILTLAFLFLAATFLAWYFTWFGRGLSDTDITKYLADEKSPRHVQHALLQVQQRIERNDASARTWYPNVLRLSKSPETEFRLTVAWLMGFDNHNEEFHGALKELINDNEPIVRRNAALALIRFGDASGRDELLAVLRPYVVKAPSGGLVASTLHDGATISRGALLARIENDSRAPIEVRSPLPGRIQQIFKPNGSEVGNEEPLLSLNSDEESVWESLRGLALIGTQDDLGAIRPFTTSDDASTRVRKQAVITTNAIVLRSSKQ